MASIVKNPGNSYFLERDNVISRHNIDSISVTKSIYKHVSRNTDEINELTEKIKKILDQKGQEV